MKRASLGMLVALLLELTGCAAILGLDTGKGPGDDGGEDAGSDAGTAGDAGNEADSVVPPQCPAGMGDCNGNPNDGCETQLNTPMHCGSCAACAAMSSCISSSCCLNEHASCSGNGDCCSGKCDGECKK